MTKTLLASTAAAFLMGVGVAIAAPATEEWLADVLSEQQADVVAIEAERAELDAFVRANTRPLFRSLMNGLDAQVDEPSEHEAVAYVRSVLAAPGPAPSVSKNLHEVTRQFGAEVIQALNRHVADTQRQLDAP